MKELIKTFIKYLLIFLFILFVLFVSNLFTHILPILRSQNLKSEIGSFIFSIIKPAFYHSIINALILSIFSYGIFILNYIHKNRALSFFLPIIVSTFIVFLILFFLKPRQKDFSFYSVNNGKIYFTEKTFLKVDDKILYLDNIQSRSINDAIFINNSQIHFMKYCPLNFYEDKIILTLQKENMESNIILNKSSLFETNKQQSIVHNTLFQWLQKTPFRFFKDYDWKTNLLLWFSVAFLVNTLTTLIRISSYPFLSAIYNTTILFLFYGAFNYTIDFHHDIINSLTQNTLPQKIIYPVVLLCIGVIFHFIRMIFFKTHVWESD